MSYQTDNVSTDIQKTLKNNILVAVVRKIEVVMKKEAL